LILPKALRLLWRSLDLSGNCRIFDAVWFLVRHIPPGDIVHLRDTSAGALIILNYVGKAVPLWQKGQSINR
jgi:hypothetical protein